MLGRFKEFTKGISSAYKYLIKIKSYGIKEFGIKGSHVMCLFYIGEAENGLTATELCKLCSEDKAAISKALSALVEKGFIELENDENKKYRSKYFLTESGEFVISRVYDKIFKAVNLAGDGLTDEERDTLYKSLSTINTNLEELCKRFEEEAE